MFLFVLLPAKADLILKKGCSKKNLVGIFNFSSNKIVLILLTKVIVFYVGFTTIHVWELDFQKLISRLFGNGHSLNFQNYFKNPLQVFLNVLEGEEFSNKEVWP